MHQKTHLTQQNRLINVRLQIKLEFFIRLVSCEIKMKEEKKENKLIVQWKNE